MLTREQEQKLGTAIEQCLLEFNDPDLSEKPPYILQIIGKAPCAITDIYPTWEQHRRLANSPWKDRVRLMAGLLSKNGGAQ